MGNRVLKSNKVEVLVLNECFICWNEINAEDFFLRCRNCSIKLHCNCEVQYRSDKKFSKCPHCQKIGNICYVKL
jgi:hypothetical protein